MPEPKFVPIILAGGSGTRFWPRSRRALAKQVLALDGGQTLIQQTCSRLVPWASVDEMYVVTNKALSATIVQQVPQLRAEHVLAEPLARNTAPACGLAAMLVVRDNPDAIIGIFPADHVISDQVAFNKAIEAAIALARLDNRLVVLGIPPTRAETGYGYIECSGATIEHSTAKPVLRFTEKPDTQSAEEFVASGRYSWNSGMVICSAQTLLDSLDRYQSDMVSRLRKIVEAFGTTSFASMFEAQYQLIDSISFDVAVLEPLSKEKADVSTIYCVPAVFGWNDLGSWDALYLHRLEEMRPDLETNVLESKDGYSIEASGNYIFAPDRVVALLGVNDLVVVQTKDALLVTKRRYSQDIGRIVAALAKHGRSDLL